MISNKRIPRLFLFSIVALAVILILITISEESEAADIIVDPNGGGDTTTIPWTTATPGNTYYIWDSEWDYTNVVIPESVNNVSFIGNGTDTVEITMLASASMDNTGDNITISGIHWKEGGTGYTFINNANDFEIHNCNFTNPNGTNIKLQGTSPGFGENIYIHNNTFYDSGFSSPQLHAFIAKDLQIENNTFLDGANIRLEGTFGFITQDVIIEYNDMMVSSTTSGITIIESDDIFISNNNIENYNPANNAKGVYAIDSSNITINWNSILDNRYTIQIINSNWLTINNNTLTPGTWFQGVPTYALLITTSNNMSIDDNTASNSPEYSIYIDSSRDGLLKYNIIVDSADINITNSINVTILEIPEEESEEEQADAHIDFFKSIDRDRDRITDSDAEETPSSRISSANPFVVIGFIASPIIMMLAVLWILGLI